MSSAAPRTNLLGLARPELEAFVAGLGAKPFRARQLLKWIYRRGESDFARMTDLAKDFRAQLAEVAEVRVPEIVSSRTARDGTRKWLLRMAGAAAAEQVIETVFIPESGRGTLCISSQIGCVLDCAFCATGQQGFNRNLTAAEIIGQVWLANRELGYDPDGERIVTNVVLMGMGEPLANYRNVLPAMRLMLDDFGYDLSRRRVTLSTSGLVPQIYRLAEDVNVALAVSLHAPNDALRDELVPINKKFPLAELFGALRAIPRLGRRHPIFFEYTLLAGVNDSSEDARRLVDLLRGTPAKVNLIPVNPHPGSPYRAPAPEVAERFMAVLANAGLTVTLRRSRGADIDAACGQLAARPAPRPAVSSALSG